MRLHVFRHFLVALITAGALICACASSELLADTPPSNYSSWFADQAPSPGGWLSPGTWPTNLYGRDVPPALRTNANVGSNIWAAAPSNAPGQVRSSGSDVVFQLQDHPTSAGASIDGMDCAKCADPPYGLYVFFAYETFRGPSDGDWQKDGLNTGANFGTSLGPISDWTGFGFQIGASDGAYDLDGAGYRAFNTDVAQGQGFFTYGFFRKPDESSRICAAVVQDWMFNTTYGLFAQNVTFSQWRTQLGYLWSDSTEIGLWGAWRGQTQSRDIPGYGPTAWRSVNQLNAYWHHKWFDGGPNTVIYVGAPERVRFDAPGSLGDWIASALSEAPITDRLSFYAFISYMHPSAAPGEGGATENFWDFSIGLAFYPGANTRTKNVNGQRWMPLLPVANNGTFLIDTNRGY